MKIISKSKIIEKAEEIISNHASLFHNYGYKFPDNAGTLFVPGYLFISFARHKGITTNKDLRTYLKKVFKTENIIEKKYEYTSQVMAFEFENEAFVVWFNATGHGSIIETNSLNHEIYHRFCLAILRKINYTIDKQLMEFIPDYLKDQISDKRKIKENFLNSFLTSKAVVNKKFKAMGYTK